MKLNFAKDRTFIVPAAKRSAVALLAAGFPARRKKAYAECKSLKPLQASTNPRRFRVAACHPPRQAGCPTPRSQSLAVGMPSVSFPADGTRFALGSNAGRPPNCGTWQLGGGSHTGAQGPRFRSANFSAEGNGLGFKNNSDDLRPWRAPSRAEINSAEAEGKAETMRP